MSWRAIRRRQSDEAGEEEEDELEGEGGPLVSPASAVGESLKIPAIPHTTWTPLTLVMIITIIPSHTSATKAL